MLSLLDEATLFNREALKYLIATKTDLEDIREISTSQGQDFAAENGFDGFFEISNKSDEGVCEMEAQVIFDLINENGLKEDCTKNTSLIISLTDQSINTKNVACCKFHPLDLFTNKLSLFRFLIFSANRFDS